MSESFIHLGMGNRQKTYLGIQQDFEQTAFGPGYVSLPSTLAGMIKDGKMLKGETKVPKGTYVQLVATLEVRPSKCRALIVPNQDLMKLGLVSCQTIKEATDRPGILVGFQPAEDVDLKDLPWLVCIYALI